MNRIKKYRNIILFLIDILIISMSYFIVSFLVKNTTEFFMPRNLELIRNTIIVSIFTYQIFFNLFDVYKNITRYENGKDYLVYIFLCVLSATSLIALSFIFRLSMLSYKQIILAMMMIAIGMISYRVIIRFILNIENKDIAKNETKKNLLIIGAGEAARDIIKTIKTKMKNAYNIVGIIDDNENKISYLISGVKILGDRYQILDICKKIM